MAFRRGRCSLVWALLCGMCLPVCRAYTCSSNDDCKYPGCFDVACASDSFYCNAGVWDYECNFHRNPKDSSYCYVHSDTGYHGFDSCPDPPVRCATIKVILGSGLCNGTESTFGACGLAEAELSAVSDQWKRKLETLYTDDACVKNFTLQNTVCAEIGGTVSDICGNKAADYCKSMVSEFQHQCVRDADCGNVAIGASQFVPQKTCCSLIRSRYKSIVCENVNVTMLDGWITNLKFSDPPGCADTDCYAGASSMCRSHLQPIISALVTLVVGSVWV